MAVWGAGAFENQDAQTFLAEVLEDGLVAIEEAIDVALDAEGDLEAPEGARALAAVELLAAILSGKDERLPPDLRGWVTQFGPEQLETLRAAALAALDLVDGERSGLREHWQHEGELGAWQAEVLRVRERLTLA